MTYYFKSSHTLDGWDIEADWQYQIDPGYPATRTEPAEPPYVYNVHVTELRFEGKVVDCPDWLAMHIMPTAEALIENANESLEQAACDAAEYRHELREDAA